MKNEIYIFVPLVLCLTACGSGSSTGMTGKPQSNTAPSPQNLPKVKKIIEHRTISKKRANTIIKDVSTYHMTSKSKNINILHIDGKEIGLSPNGMSSNGNGFMVLDNSTTYLKVSGGTYKYMRLGFYGEQKDQYGRFDLSKVFAQGEHTHRDNFPKTNQTFTYNGNALFSDKGVGDVELKVNFANKSVTGIIDNLTGFQNSASGLPPANKYEFVATMMWGAVGDTIRPRSYFHGTEMKIDGQVVGTGTPATGGRTSTSVSGSFFGPNAEEVGGHWNGDRGFIFGAKR